MALIRWNPVNTLDFFRDFDSMIDHVFSRPGRLFHDAETTWAPRIDVVEKEKSYELHAELPGVSKNEIEISVKDDVLTISGKKKSEEKKEDRNYYCCERRFGSFERSFRMAETIDANNVSAEYENGVLTVTVPKVEAPESKAKKIQIK